jgi:hypothetical protein
MNDLQIYDTLEQGSDEWLQARCGILTASVIGKLITPTLKVADNDTSRGLTETLVAERISGHVDYVHPSFDMQRGTLDEPYARELYAQQYGPVREVGFAIRTIGNLRLGASPDGLVEEDGGIEIKSRRPKTHIRTIVTDRVPAENMAQIQTCMLVFDRPWWDYISYAGGYPLYVERVERDEAWQTAIVDAAAKFEENAALMVAQYEHATKGLPIAPRVDHFAEIEIG